MILCKCDNTGIVYEYAAGYFQFLQETKNNSKKKADKQAGKLTSLWSQKSQKSFAVIQRDASVPWII